MDRLSSPDQRIRTFGKESRLLKKADFSLCYSKGKRHFTTSFIFFTAVRREKTSSRLGLAISRKVGGAVRRNRIKRLLREFFRLHQTDLPLGLDLVAVPRKGLDSSRLDYAVVEQELIPLIKEWRKYYKSNQDNPPVTSKPGGKPYNMSDAS